MFYKWLRKLSYLFFLCVGCACADNSDSPCAGSYALLALIDRPTIGDSACVVPNRQAIVELGYQYQTLTHQGIQQNLPEAELRFGLPLNNELAIILPNDIYQSKAPRIGATATFIGIKHQLAYRSNWVTSIEGFVVLPNGSTAFGNDKTSGYFNAIFSYNLSTQFNITSMLGVSTETQTHQVGGQRFNSINPDLVLSWTPRGWIVLYVEVYGQSQTGPHESSGFNMDTGINYLLTPHFSMDLEVGQRLSGNLDGFNHYIGAGMGIYFDP
jgi:hypothetical protein